MTTVHTPPNLPTYFADAFNLNPIVGVPTDEEVKLIHSVIRAVENTSHKHMLSYEAKYKSKHSFPMISDITYAPPELPPHMNILLEPVVNTPSEDQLRSAQAALRFSEGMVNTRTEGNHTTRDAPAGVESQERRSTQKSRIPIEVVLDAEPIAPSEVNRVESVARSEHNIGPDARASPSDYADLTSTMVRLLTGVNGVIEQLKANQEQTDQRLVRIQDLLKDGLRDGLRDGLKDGLRDGLKDGLKNALGSAVEKVTRMMIKLHNHSARTLPMPGAQSGIGYTFWGNFADDTLAQYLHFYNIGMELVEQGGIPKLKPNSKEQAKRILGRYSHCRT
ncbi:hypothetical protein BDV93DRAFT_512896 [Ceratobasidium sp. AG-I]|nr:hypothetical protein BDV93DRAFT_512896 [Ceratobasidium sp. AG-I]